MKKNLLLLLAIVALAAQTATARNVVIPIESAQKGLYILADNSGGIRQAYFGDKIKNHQDLLTMSPSSGENQNNIYPTFGMGHSGEVALKVTHVDGNMTTRLRYKSHKETTSSDGNVKTTTIIMQDEYYPLEVKLIYTSYYDENVITSSTEISHQERGDILIQGAVSNYLTVKSNRYFLTRYHGGWASEMQMVESEIVDGVTVLDSKTGVRTSQDGLASFILSIDDEAREDKGEVILGSLAWSGNYKLAFEVNNGNALNILSGINDFLSDYHLGKGETYKTPEMVLAHSSNGTGEASRNLHRWVRKYSTQDGDQSRPIVLNSWEGAYFKFDEQIIMNMIADAASMGVELFVLDDGWFGTKYPRNTDHMGLGDWDINFEKLPNGLSGLIKQAEAHNIDFGLWVEPEMVNPQSILAEKHPDWIITSPNRTTLLQRTQLLLDLTNPKVREYVYDVVAKLLKEYPEIKYIKWDANRHVQDFGSQYLAKGEQSHFWVDYINNLYNVYERLSEEFPDVIFQACSSGGGRVDYGSLKYHHEIWGSDNTDAEWRIYINWGLNYFVPAGCVASHVSQSPNHQTSQLTPIKFRFDVAMSQRLGLELQPKLLTDEELAWTKEAVEVYKSRIRDVVQLGDQYRLASPYDFGGFSSIGYVSEDKDRAIIFAYSLDYQVRGASHVVKLAGLDPAKQYTVREVMPTSNKFRTLYRFTGEGKTFSGDYLMKVGIQVNIGKRFDSSVLELIAK